MSTATKEQDAGSDGNNAQRDPSRMLKTRKSNIEVRDGKCYIIFRSELDPRWPEPQFIDEQVIDRNRLDSLNMQHLNPDVTKHNQVKCICTRLINLLEDWYVQNHEGTILCNSCARCFRCRILCFTAGRKLNSIDGLVLCNACMLNYGSYRESKLRPRLQPMERLLDDMATSAAKVENDNSAKDHTDDSADTSTSKTEDPKGKHNNSKQGGYGKHRSKSSRNNRKNSNSNSNKNIMDTNDKAGWVLEKPRFRNEGRRPLRLILHPDKRPKNYGRPDHCFEAPPYLGVDRKAGSQACPECIQPALGNKALVVPSMTRVYHERSFRCANCKRPMYMGHQLPMAQFQACSCPQHSKVYCTEYSCQMARMAHHAERKCTLEPVHPGGRPKRDVPGFAPIFDPAASDKKAGQQTKEREQKDELSDF